MSSDVDQRLRPRVSGIATRVFDNATYVHAPDTATTIVLCSTTEGAFVVGPRDTARYCTARTGERTVVRLTPGRAQAVLDVPVGRPAGWCRWASCGRGPTCWSPPR